MGYLNTKPDDDYNLQTMAQGGNVTTELPGGASGFDGLLTTIPKALTSAAGSLGSLAESTLGRVADTATGGAYRADLYGDENILGPKPSGLLDAGHPDPVQAGVIGLVQNIDQQTRDSANAATAVMSQWAATGEDPRVTDALGRTVLGPVKEGSASSQAPRR